VLRDAGAALYTSQIRARHHKLFGGDISENAIGSTLARLKEALIVERGTNDLYENLDRSPGKIALWSVVRAVTTWCPAAPAQSQIPPAIPMS
jgi:hypothetical protein